MEKLLQIIFNLIRKINYKLIVLATYILIIFTLVNFIDVIMRYFFNSPIIGVKQLSEYALVWLCFFGVGWVLTERAHVGITLLEERIFKKYKNYKKKYLFFVDLICLCYSLILLWLNLKETWVCLRQGRVLTGELGGIPESLMYFSISIGFFCLTIQLMVNLTAYIFENKFQSKNKEK